MLHIQYSTALSGSYTSALYQNILPLWASSGEDETLPNVVFSGHAGSTEIGNEPPSISSHTQLEGIVGGQIKSPTLRPQVL